MLITIVEARPYELEAVNKDGEKETYKGNVYGGFVKGGEAINFSSEKDHKVVEAIGFDSRQAEDIKIKTKIFDGKVKHQEERD